MNRAVGAARHLHSVLAFRIARRLGRPAVTVGGAWGRFTGASDDDVMLRHYGRYGTWSAAVVRLLADTARDLARHRPVRLLDIGAAIGLVGIGVARQAPVLVQAFEPNSETFAFLARNVARSGLASRIELQRCALGAPPSGEETVSLLRRLGNGGDCRIAPLGAGPLTAPLRRLDAVATPPGEAALLVKIDVQGAEPEVLAGGPVTLAHAGLLVIEFWPVGLRARGHDPQAFARQLADFDGEATLLFDEHRPQVLRWSAPAALRPELERLAASDDPAQQAEVILRPMPRRS